MDAQVAIHAEGVVKSYGDFRAVDALSFDVQRGEIFALLGPNGAGKSTTIRMILDILRPDSGRIAVLGGPLNDATRNRIGYLPEERGLYRNVPVLDVMIYLGQLKGMTHAAAKRRALDLLARLDLADHARSKVSELSKGMQQKVQFAVTVIHEPDLIIVDEPFSGLDPVNTLVIKELLGDLRDRGVAVVMSTHQMQQVEEMADRLLMINRGQQKLYGPVTQIRQQFASHAIIVEGSGQWDNLPGVDSVEMHRNGRETALLHLAADVTPESVLAAIAASGQAHLRRFELAVPSLNDIFIQVVAEGRHE